MMVKKIFVALAIVIVLAASILAGKIYYQQNVIFTDYPHQLSDSVQTLEISYIAWACDCANWREVNKEGDYFFLEAANNSLEIPEDYWKNHLSKRLFVTGRFYKDIGLPRDHIMNTEIKPDKARVFR